MKCETCGRGDAPAAELEQLRVYWREFRDQNAALAAERDALKADVEHLHSREESWGDRLEHLRAERDALREALEECIAHASVSSEDEYAVLAASCLAVILTARAAQGCLPRGCEQVTTSKGPDHATVDAALRDLHRAIDETEPQRAARSLDDVPFIGDPGGVTLKEDARRDEHDDGDVPEGYDEELYEE